MADQEQLLHRQVHPAWLQQGRFTSQTFTPTPKDAGLCSVYDGDLIDPQQSFTHYTKVLGQRSVGVVSVAVAEVQAVGLTWRPDPEPFPEHAVHDVAGCMFYRPRNNEAECAELAALGYIRHIKQGELNGYCVVLGRDNQAWENIK
jgi:hypothetical protein